MTVSEPVPTPPNSSSAASSTSASPAVSRSAHSVIAIGVSGVITALALWAAWTDRWVCDDAFISFRYADNLVAGHGLVWNPGERVEGFSNLLWTLFLVPAAALRLDLVLVSEALGIASLGGLALVLWRWAREGAGRSAPLPLALWATLALQDVISWSTGGLETMTFSLLAAAMALALLGRAQVSPRRELAAGALGALLLLTRPDGFLLAACLGAGYAAMRWPDGRRAVLGSLARVEMPVVLALAGVTAFRLFYYGDPLPNTYYAKSAGQAYWSQGLVYVALLAARDWSLPLAIVVGLVLGARHLRAVERGAVPITGWWPGPGAVLAATATAFTLYVARSGGDFMFARRLIPVIPLVFMAVEREFLRLTPSWRRTIGALALSAAAASPFPIYSRWAENGRIARVSDEASFYDARRLALRQAQGEALGRAFDGIDATFLIGGGLCMLAYYSRLPHMIEPNGLTDRVVAKQELSVRGIPGHEKTAPLWYLRQRRVQFQVRRGPPSEVHTVDTVSIARGLVRLGLLIYDEPVMTALAQRPEVTFTPIAERLESARRGMNQLSCDQARRVLDTLDQIYFDWNTTVAARRPDLQAAVARACAEDARRDSAGNPASP